jgi:hypothetical protein
MWSRAPADRRLACGEAEAAIATCFPR